jgi:PAS domain S-box-containing protein
MESGRGDTDGEANAGGENGVADDHSMAKALDTSEVAAFVLDEQFRVAWVNGAVEEYFGVPAERLLGADKAGLVESEIKEIFEEPERFAGTVLASYEDNSYVESFECHVLPGEGREERWLLHSSSPIEAGEYAGGRIEHYTDITERKRYERRLRDQRDDLDLLNEVLRHDIRNDLQLVVAYAELLADRVDGEELEYVETIRDSADHAVELTTTARDMAEVMLTTEDDARPTALRPALENELDKVRSAYPEAAVTVGGTVPDVEVLADDMLGSAFANLLKNAIQHNDKDVPEVRVSVTLTDDYAVVRVADNGPGIPEADTEAVFDKGMMGIDSEGGGVGLYLVRTLVESYGGTVRVEHAGGGGESADADRADAGLGGAVFLVELPLAAAD